MGPNEGENGLTIKRGPKCLGHGDGRNKGGTCFENEGLHSAKANDSMTTIRGRARCN